MTTAQSTGSLPLRVLHSVAHHGVRRTWINAWSSLAWRYQEWRLGIRTRASIHADTLGHAADNFGYQPINARSFKIAMRSLAVEPQRDVFLDYGCGMGRAVVLAALSPLARVTGVERSGELCEIARENVRRAERRLKCRQIEIVQADATAWQVPDDVTIVFLYNPFGGDVLLQTMQRLRESVERRPRRLRIVYALPKPNADRLAELSWLTKQQELKTQDSDWMQLTVYESDTMERHHEHQRDSRERTERRTSPCVVGDPQRAP